MLQTTCGNSKENVSPNKIHDSNLHIEDLHRKFRSLDSKWKRIMFFSRLTSEESEILQQMLKSKI